MSISYIQLPPEGPGKKIYTNQQTISGNTIQVQCVNIVSNDLVTKQLRIDQRGSNYIKFKEGDPILSAYEDLKTIESHILGVYEHTIDSYDDLFTIIELSGGTSTFEITESSVILAVNDEPYSKCARITNRYHYYQPTTSFLVLLTVSCGDLGKTNNKRQWGLFDDNYGLYFELSGTTINLVSRSQNYAIFPQSSWNIDKLDGTGPSGVVLDVTKTYQYFINVNYPSNMVAFGIYHALFGRIICHRINGAGRASFPNLKYLSLPIQFNNENIGHAGSGSELREIMSVVLVEAFPDYTFWRFADLGCTNRTATLNSPIFSIRPKLLINSNPNHVNSYPESMSVFSTENIKLQVVSHNGTILSGATFNIEYNGPLQADDTATWIDTNNSQYWIMKTYYIEKDMATNLDLSTMYEINDEGCLLSADNVTQNTISYVATSLDNVAANVTIMLSYRSLY